MTRHTCLSDELHAAVRCAGDETVAQIPTGQLPGVDAGETVKTGSNGETSMAWQYEL